MCLKTGRLSIRFSMWFNAAIISVMTLACCVISPLTQAQALSEIKARGAINLCANPEQMPFSQRADSAEGFQIDIARAIAEKLDVALNVSWIFSKRQAKKVGCDFYAGVARFKDRDSRYLLITDPYLHLEFKLVTLANGAVINGINDLKPMVVGVSPGSIASHALTKNHIRIAVRFQDEASRLQALADGLIDAAVVTNVSAGWYQENHDRLQVIDAENILGTRLNYDYALGLRMSDEDSRNGFNRLLAEMKSDGSLLEIFNRYGVK
ncbi:substrate-binding periplasmic protein [Amphritea pacifica]|uniref:Transporter substrate-binding domain-containing protein n=1 Tax=Amphritea pacifica TaxID=2811233 RepID=A0ABS2W9E6_9GAMM|nr:transporter substrate-binding domain-containing protein [Amphritea pacifica]MBN0988330.1 transporter substrate-binding domain-containing protein [Amphritea pacifica]MBN1005559.1 transporter substrate-binding domain-containing protein [Amphritea pacifica]